MKRAQAYLYEVVYWYRNPNKSVLYDENLELRNSRIVARDVASATGKVGCVLSDVHEVKFVSVVDAV